MINLESLTLHLNLKRKRFINGIHLEEKVLIHLPKLTSFTFHIFTTISIYNTNYLLSADDIQKTFIDWKYSLVNCCVYYFDNRLGVSHIYSTAAKMTYIKHVANRFHGKKFRFVTDLKLYGTCSFEHSFFKQIARVFPLLKYFTLHNLMRQEKKREIKIINGKPRFPVIQYLHLTRLNFIDIHIDYALQFLCYTNTYCPNLDTLMIQYDQLITVTNNFASDLTRKHCAQIKRLLTDELIVYPEHFYCYFPSLEK
jgi:hypothetical protein